MVNVRWYVKNLLRGKNKVTLQEKGIFLANIFRVKVSLGSVKLFISPSRNSSIFFKVLNSYHLLFSIDVYTFMNGCEYIG